MRVLVVDNDRDAVDCLAMLLRFANCDVRTAYDGFACLEEATKFLPELLLADLGMPQMDGCELARQIRQCRSLDRTVLAALTGYADAQHRELALAAGFTEYLVKPVPAESLYELLGRVAETVKSSRRLTEECHRQADISAAVVRRSMRHVGE
ncbi:MAG TPA: response regulator [Pirellulales bacterium]|nr:response regulator [Pirellulales bacterium]